MCRFDALLRSCGSLERLPASGGGAARKKITPEASEILEILKLDQPAASQEECRDFLRGVGSVKVSFSAGGKKEDFSVVPSSFLLTGSPPTASPACCCVSLSLFYIHIRVVLMAFFLPTCLIVPFFFHVVALTSPSRGSSTVLSACR